MRKLFLFSLVFVMSITFGFANAYAGVGTDLSGAHWNLNIIGVPHDKTVPEMKGSHRHTIFVPLSSGEDVGRQVKIEYVIGDDFQVLDGNATDDNEAIIQVPYEYCDDYDEGCVDLLSFNVYAVGLGKPNGNAIITAECTYEDEYGNVVGDCTSTLLMGSFTIKRKKGNPKPEDITNVFRATGCIDLNDNGECDTGDLTFRNIWVFNIEQLVEYMWDYDNNGLKLMQVRFYETTSGQIGYVK